MGARADSQNAAFHTISCKQYALPMYSWELAQANTTLVPFILYQMCVLVEQGLGNLA